MNKDKSEDKKESPQNQSNLVPPVTPGSSLNQQETNNSTNINKEKKITACIGGYWIKFKKIVHSNSPVLLLVVTLTYTIFAGRQWCTMEKQAQIMEKQWKTLDRQMAIGERAWVTVEKVSFKDFKGFNVGEKITVITKIINAGKTPAFDTNVAVFVELYPPTAFPSVFAKFPYFVVGGTSVSVIGPNGERESPATWHGELTDDIIKLAKQEKVALYVWGGIQYDDIFGLRHNTYFCLRNSLNSETFKFCEFLNKAD
jgi:hypothetical protein